MCFACGYFIIVADRSQSERYKTAQTMSSVCAENSSCNIRRLHRREAVQASDTGGFSAGKFILRLNLYGAGLFFCIVLRVLIRAADRSIYPCKYFVSLPDQFRDFHFRGMLVVRILHQQVSEYLLPRVWEMQMQLHIIRKIRVNFRMFMVQ